MIPVLRGAHVNKDDKKLLLNISIVVGIVVLIALGLWLL